MGAERGTATSAGVETVIGLECHVELSTATKMFCACRNAFGAPPNTNVCPVCLGLPGSLPVPNERAIEFIARIGLALGAEIAPRSLFHRKNYFYPDMPKNFQISQYDLPVCVGGQLDVEVDGETRRIGITRVHMEEDTGKTTHAGATGRIAEADYALVDYNRAGVPLVEIVSEPDLRSPVEAAAYLRELRSLLLSLDVSDVRMEEGSFRCDANVSVRPVGSRELGTKVEIKNMNSVRSVERAIRHEAERQAEALEKGEPLIQETRHWSEDLGVTTSMRSKEEAFDYRYFPEPDLPPLEPERGWVEGIREALPELPAARRARLAGEHELKPETVRMLVGTPGFAEAFEEAVGLGAAPKAVANWLVQDVAGFLNKLKLELSDSGLTARHLADLVRLVEDGTISTAGAKQVVEHLLTSAATRIEARIEQTLPAVEQEAAAELPDVEAVVDERGLRQVSDTGELARIVDEVIEENPEPVESFRGGKEGVFGFLVGQVMRKSGGSANPKLAGDLLRERLGG